MSENIDLSSFDFDPQFPYHSRVSWPIPIAQHGSTRAAPSHSANANTKRSTTPLQGITQTYEHSMGSYQRLQSHPMSHPQAYAQPAHNSQSFQPQPSAQAQAYQRQRPLHHGIHPQLQNINYTYGTGMASQQQGFQTHGQVDEPTTWDSSQPKGRHQNSIPYSLDSQNPPQYAEPYAMPYQTSPTDYVQGTQGQYENNLAASYLPLGQMDGGMPFNWQSFSSDLLNYPVSNGLGDMGMQQTLPNSPGTSLEVRSLSSSDNGWGSVEYTHHSLDSSSYTPQVGAIFNPEQTLHGRTFSDSSYSDVENTRLSWSSFVDIPQHAIGSPSSDSAGDLEFHNDMSDQDVQIKQEKLPSPLLASSQSAISQPINIKVSTSPNRSPVSSGRTSPPGRRQAKKNSNAKATKATIRRQSHVKAETEKKVGRRKGPLRPEQRKQASEIRKLGACLRCKFLKKTVSQSSQFSRSAY